MNQAEELPEKDTINLLEREKSINLKWILFYS
jgi:hypothetical protein